MSVLAIAVTDDNVALAFGQNTYNCPKAILVIVCKFYHGLRFPFQTGMKPKRQQGSVGGEALPFVLKALP
jgi:hypothetical protein